MPLAGNDIVALNEPDNLSAPYRPRFLEKLFTPDEQAWIRQQADIGIASWCLWACKESAYKLGRKLGDPRSYSPKNIRVTPQGNMPATELKCLVHHNQRILPVTCYINPEFVHAIAALDMAHGDTIQTVFRAGNPDDVSISIRKAIISSISNRYGIAPAEIRIIQRSDKIPQLYAGNLPLPIDLSISHDGNWGAFVYHENKT
jgi:phosphopantetheinyl transferase